MFIGIGVRRPAALLAALALSTLITLGASSLALAAEPTVKLSITPDGISGSYFELTMAPGETRELAVLIGNHGTATVPVRTYAADVYTIVNGGFGARLSGEPTGETTSWVQYQSEVLSIEPGTGIRRTFTVTVPLDATPGERITSLVVQNDEPVSTGTGVVIRQVLRQAVAVAITVPGPLVPGLRIGAARHGEVAGRSVLAVEVENIGNVRLRPTAEFTLTDGAGKVVSTARLPMGSFYAGTATLVELPLAALLLPGPYRIALTLADAERSVQGEARDLPLVVAAPPAAEPAEIGAVRELTAVAQQLAATVSVGAAVEAVQLGAVAVSLVASLIATAGMLLGMVMRDRRIPLPAGRNDQDPARTRPVKRLRPSADLR